MANMISDSEGNAVGPKNPLSIAGLVQDNTGVWFSLDSCRQTVGWSGGLMTSITALDVVKAITRVQTITYDSLGRWTGTSEWVRQ